MMSHFCVSFGSLFQWQQTLRVRWCHAYFIACEDAHIIRGSKIFEGETCLSFSDWHDRICSRPPHELGPNSWIDIVVDWFYQEFSESIFWLCKLYLYFFVLSFCKSVLYHKQWICMRLSLTLLINCLKGRCESSNVSGICCWFLVSELPENNNPCHLRAENNSVQCHECNLFISFVF